MATVNKDFRVKNGLVVEGTTAIVNGSNVLTEASTTFLNNIIKDQSGDLLTNATLTNLTISYDDVNNALTITAENGVTDSDTDDLAEGITNLYFTDERAQDAFGTLVSNGSYSGATVVYDDATNAFNISITDQFLSHDTDDLAEGTTNLYFTDARALNAVQSSYEAYADQAELDAIASANSYTDGRETAITTAYQGYADQAESDAISTSTTYTDNLIGDGTVDGTAGNTVKDRIDTAVSDLIGGAPELLDTLNELAAAIADDENFATTIASDIATGVTNANAYTDARETAITTAYQSYADTAEADAIATAAADATSKANTAESNANTFTTNSIDALDTDDIEEGSTNLYFTDARAVSAMDNALITPQTVDIQQNGTNTGMVLSSFSGTQISRRIAGKFTIVGSGSVLNTRANAVKLLVKARNEATGDVEMLEAVAVMDGSGNIHATEYGSVSTSGSSFITLVYNNNEGNIQISADGPAGTPTTVTVDAVALMS